MQSEKVVIEAPMSLSGSAKRIWRLSDNNLVKLLVLLPLIGLAWGIICVWYCVFGILLIPYRLMRRSQRKQKLAKLRHQELMQAVSQKLES